LSTPVFWILSLIATVMTVLAFRHLGRRRLLYSRERKETLHVRGPVSNQVDPNVLSDVIEAVGRAYVVDPSLISPEVTLETFDDVDSWDLGAGTDALSDWLASRGVGPGPVNAKTILDLARVVDEAGKQR